MNRAVIASGAVALHGHVDQGGCPKWKSLHPTLLRLLSAASSAAAVAACRPNQHEERRLSHDDSLKQAMYINCWAQS